MAPHKERRWASSNSVYTHTDIAESREYIIIKVLYTFGIFLLSSCIYFSDMKSFVKRPNLVCRNRILIIGDA